MCRVVIITKIRTKGQSVDIGETDCFMMASYFSTLVSGAMDCIGYSEQSIRLRAKTFKEFYDILSQHVEETFHMEIILAGSKSEGVVPYHASDLDIMCILQSCICVDQGQLEDKLTVIETYMKNCPPGYTKLRPLHIENTGISLMLYLFSVYDISNGVLYLKSVALSEMLLKYSDNFLHFYDGYNGVNKSLSGPALAITYQPSVVMGVQQSNVYSDQVLAIRYYSSRIMQEWVERNRQFDWPPPDVIEDVSTTEGYVVPVGHKLSEEQSLEWRICFTTGECKLVASFNTTQLKLYVLLKLTVKEILKPAVDCVSSYMVKNVVFWVMEHTPTLVFTPSTLTKCVIHALWFLFDCLRNNNLPNYMIPNRNLFIGKVQGKQKQGVKNLVRELLNEGETLVFRFEKLKNAVYVYESNRCLATRVQSWRDEIEQLLLIINLKFTQNTTKKMRFQQSLFYDVVFEYWKDESYIPVIGRLLYLLHFDLSAILTNGGNGIKDMDKWLHNLLSY